jgi:hypothetical protein
VLTSIQFLKAARAQPGASNLSTLVCGKINFAATKKSRKSEMRKGLFFLFYFICLEPQDRAFLKQWEAQISCCDPQLLKFLPGEGVLAISTLWFVTSPNKPL